MRSRAGSGVKPSYLRSSTNAKLAKKPSLLAGTAPRAKCPKHRLSRSQYVQRGLPKCTGADACADSTANPVNQSGHSTRHSCPASGASGSTPLVRGDVLDGDERSVDDDEASFARADEGLGKLGAKEARRSRVSSTYRQAVAVKTPNPPRVGAASRFSTGTPAEPAGSQTPPPRAAFTPSGTDEARDMLNQFVRDGDVERGSIRDQARLLGRSVVRREHRRNDQEPCLATPPPLTCAITPAEQDEDGSAIAWRPFPGVVQPGQHRPRGPAWSRSGHHGAVQCWRQPGRISDLKLQNGWWPAAQVRRCSATASSSCPHQRTMTWQHHGYLATAAHLYADNTRRALIARTNVEEESWLPTGSISHIQGQHDRRNAKKQWMQCQHARTWVSHHWKHRPGT